MNQPIEAISCCHCTSCQGYIKELETRISNLEAVAHTPELFPDAWDEKAMKRVNEFVNIPVVTPRQLGERVLFGELEKRVQVLESYLQADPAFLPYGQLEKRIDELESFLYPLPAFDGKNFWALLLEQAHDIDRQRNRVQELEGKIETLWKWANDTGAASFASQSGRIRELEEKVESLTRTLDMWQEIMGIEVVVTAQAHEGVCEKCDRVGQLNDGNICEGCFYEEIGV